MPSPSMLMAIAALGGVLVGLLTVVLGIVALLWNKLDKRFDKLEAAIKEQRQEDMARIDKRFDRLEELVKEALKSPR